MISGITQEAKDPKEYLPPLLDSEPVNIHQIHLKNERISRNDDSSLQSKDDEESCDTRTFSKTTLSQLRTTFALDKTIKNSFKQNIKKNKNQNKNSFSRKSSSHSILSNGSSLDLSSRGPITLKSNDMMTKFWKSFEKFAIPQPGKLGRQENTLLALALPVSSLHSAIQLMSRLNIEIEVNQIIENLGLSQNESLSWVEYRDICSQLFQNQTTHIVSQTSPPQTSSRESQKEFSVGSQAYDRLIRVDRTANTIPHSVSEPSLAESYVPDKTSSLQKDSLCVVLKQQYRKIRKEEDTGKPFSISRFSDVNFRSAGLFNGTDSKISTRHSKEENTFHH